MHDCLHQFSFHLIATATAALVGPVIIVHASCFRKNRSTYLSILSRHNIIIILMRQRIAPTRVFRAFSTPPPSNTVVTSGRPPTSLPSLSSSSPSFVFRSTVFHFFVVTTSTTAVIIIVFVI